jgi:DNA-binding transcriptional regulator YiaG
MSKIKEARLKADLSQASMSKMLDIPKRTIEAWETGDRKPPLYVEKLIVAELNRIADNKIAEEK